MRRRRPRFAGWCRHLRHRSDAQNVDLMGLAGFCRNCLSDWVQEASGGALDKEAAREAIYGMPYAEWKAAPPGRGDPGAARAHGGERREECVMRDEAARLS